MRNAVPPQYRMMLGQQPLAVACVALMMQVERKSYDPIGGKKNLFTPDEVKLINAGEINGVIAMKAGIVFDATMSASEAVCESRRWNPNTSLNKQVAAVVILEQFEAGKKAADSLPSFHEHAVATARYARITRPLEVLQDKAKMGGYASGANDRFENKIERLVSKGKIINKELLFASGNVDENEYNAYAESLRSSAMAVRQGYQKNPLYAMYES